MPAPPISNTPRALTTVAAVNAWLKTPISALRTAYITAGPNGTTCYAWTVATGPQLNVAHVRVGTYLLNLLYPLVYKPCPAATAASPAAPPAGPTVIATQFWRTIPLPVPDPTIPPGYAITGKPAYLVTGGTVAPPPYQQNTPFGMLRVVARGTYYVQWGGSAVGWAGPFSGEGLPYPDGGIVHTYDRVGTVTVQVRETWSATWTLGSASGTLSQLSTEATIPALVVRQVQAVITG